MARTGAWITEAVPSVMVPRLHTSVEPFAEIEETGVTPFVLQTVGMLANTPFVTVSVARTSLTGSFASGSVASFVLMCHSDVTAFPYGADEGLPTQFAVISCTAVVAALAAPARPKTEKPAIVSTTAAESARNPRVGESVYQKRPRTPMARRCCAGCGSGRLFDDMPHRPCMAAPPVAVTRADRPRPRGLDQR
ncbi:hypothetical protein GCM10025881_25170 [Pseudolysinimonas kribbensis]|uniref:Uncharacterized protein n=1 Tax=Pseudolysinimonas kribbensis TaxID=433641 RepID=A0ABQ6K5I8_9MICO|nr:hypothetical protein [Pseudolysinimonas kribbensis]GMA95693.1 hypothetical protein GCM10025881_25170 [Pseudolysinimonas kribbensis]